MLKVLDWRSLLPETFTYKVKTFFKFFHKEYKTTVTDVKVLHVYSAEVIGDDLKVLVYSREDNLIQMYYVTLTNDTDSDYFDDNNMLLLVNTPKGDFVNIKNKVYKLNKVI